MRQGLASTGSSAGLPPVRDSGGRQGTAAGPAAAPRAARGTGSPMSAGGGPAPPGRRDRREPDDGHPVRQYRHKAQWRRKLLENLRPIARWTVLGGSWAAVLFVLGYAAALRWLGESWWATTVALYLPHWVLLAPLGALALGALILGPRSLLLLHLGAAAIVLFPVMGLRLGGPNQPTPGAPRLRVVSFNVGSGARSIPGIVEEVTSHRPDLVLLQESAPEVNAAVAAALPGYATLTSTQFFVASRGAISELYEPPKVDLDDVDRSARFIRVTVETPAGKLDVYNVHPISPREALTSVHEDSFLGGLRGDHAVIIRNTRLRRLQAETIAKLAAASPNPVLIAGDTNLPQSSRILAGTLGRWKDGFDEAGRGLGYTFPVTRRGPWMRIDRIFSGPELRFLQFGVGRSASSDHHCVWAELERLPR